MKIFSKASVIGFIAGFICFPVVLWGGLYLYMQLASDGLGGGGQGLAPPDIPSETRISLDWTVQGLDGAEINLKEYAQDKPVFLNFWATWCPPCVDEMPSIERLYGQFGDSMAFVCISQEDETTLRKFVEAKNYSLPVFRTASDLPSELNAQALPTTFILSPEGRILLKHLGGADWSHESVVAFLREKLSRG
jgi:thiol-disulfide isomerase/thioredoxin